MRLAFLALSFALAIAPARADVKMPAIFGDHMVLQQDAKLPVWGTANPGERVTVTVGPHTGQAVAGADGKWRVILQPLKGAKTLTFSDVLVGDVWICSGQSNMEYGLGGANNAATEVPAANHPLIRLFIVAHHTSFTPEDDLFPNPDPAQALVGHWQVCTPDTVVNKGGWKGFSAVAYFFGKEMQAQTHQPVGLIQCPWGGMPVQSFISLDVLKSHPEFASYVQVRDKELADSPGLKAAYPAAKADFDKQKADWDKQYGDANTKALAAYTQTLETARLTQAPVPPKPVPPVPAPKMPPDGNPKPNTASNIFNGMINPLIPYAIKGAIWYQGESNTGGPWDYDKLFAAMIGDWRQRWGVGDFPFLYVQLANFLGPQKTPVELSGYAAIRDMQLRTLKVPETGMAVAIDVGEAADIHPRDKADVGHRLALAARHLAGEKIDYSGPIYDSMEVDGDKIRINFKHAAGLKIGAHPQLYKETEGVPAELSSFAIAGADKKWVAAKAKIKGDSVIVSSDAVKSPIAVRYGWANNPDCHLYNGANLPASPFRTDDWPDPPPTPAQAPAPNPAKP
jgi:sialate O-acetylesterase